MNLNLFIAIIINIRHILNRKLGIMEDKNEWGSNLSFILAMIGSAVGLGNIWRYPYVLYSNGGGAFYIPYIVAILLMGISVFDFGIWCWI